MKKKMLQRSLALGALMALAITGSALAATIEGNVVTNDNNIMLTETDINGAVQASDGCSVTLLGGSQINSNLFVGLNVVTNGKAYLGSDKEVGKNYIINDICDTGARGIQVSNSILEIIGNEISISGIAKNTGGGFGVTAFSNSNVTISGNNVNILGSNKDSGGYAIYNGDSVVNVIANNDLNLKASSDHSTLLIVESTGNTKLEANNINIEGSMQGTKSVAYGLSIDNGGIIEVKAKQNFKVALDAPNTDSWVMGITTYADVNNQKGGHINIDADNIDIDISAENGYASGIHVQNNTQDETAPDWASAITINANTIDIDSTGSGISAYSNGQMKITGDLTINAPNAIDVRGNSTVNINIDDAHSTALNGDIVFETPNAPGDSQNSGNLINAYVDVHFTGEDSVWNGRAYKHYRVQNDDEWVGIESVDWETPNRYGYVTGFKVSFKDGATWNLTGPSIVNDATFGAGSTLKIKGSDFEESTGKYALNGSGTLAVEEGAKLVIDGMEKNTYNIATGFTTNQGENFTVVNDNALMQTEMKLTDKNLQAVVSAKTADEVASSGIVTSSGVNMLAELAGDIASGNVAVESQPAADFITDAMSGMASGNTTQAAAAAVNSALQLAEAGGNSATAISVVNNVASLTTQRLSFTQLSTTPTGGFGRVVRKDSSGAGVWAQYVHGKDKVDDMPMDGMRSSYDSQYNGALLGFDFKKIGKYQGGVAFSYGEGDSNSKNSAIRTRSDYKFYGVGYYGNIMNDDSNVMFDVNFSKSESDVEQHNAGYKLEASPDTTTISAGVKLEKLIQNNEVQIVPYAGLRFLSVDTDEYKANIAGKTAFMYAPDRQNIWLIPVGVSLRQENVYDSGWKVTPKVDLSYIWALGDTDSSMTVSIPGVSAVSDLGYTVMDNGSFLGTIGLEASKGNWSYGLNYSYQKGEYQRSDKWYVDVHYSF